MGIYVVEEFEEPSDYYVPRVFSDRPEGWPTVQIPTELYLRWRRAMNEVEKIEEQIYDITHPSGCACTKGCASRVDHKGSSACWYRLPEEERW